MKLRFRESQIRQWAERYAYSQLESRLLALRTKVQSAGYLTMANLRLLARWKSPRNTSRIEQNSEGFVADVTRFALCARDERARIEALTILDGVKWPTASVVLHIFHTDQYPILDFRALWAVGVKVPSQYTFEDWWPYTQYCRKLAERNGVTMRTLDRALWQFSKANQ